MDTGCPIFIVVVNTCRFVFGDWIIMRSFGELLIEAIDVCAVIIVSFFLPVDRYLVSPPEAQTTRVIAGRLTGEFEHDVDACSVTGLGVRLMIKSDGFVV
jgi:hypothetical protein